LGQRGVEGKHIDGQSVPFILSKSKTTAVETLMLIRRMPA
jgi:hypothetical protein